MCCRCVQFFSERNRSNIGEDRSIWSSKMSLQNTYIKRHGLFRCCVFIKGISFSQTSNCCIFMNIGRIPFGKKLDTPTVHVLYACEVWEQTKQYFKKKTLTKKILFLQNRYTAYSCCLWENGPLNPTFLEQPQSTLRRKVNHCFSSRHHSDC